MLLLIVLCIDDMLLPRPINWHIADSRFELNSIFKMLNLRPSWAFKFGTSVMGFVCYKH